MKCCSSFQGLFSLCFFFTFRGSYLFYCTLLCYLYSKFTNGANNWSKSPPSLRYRIQIILFLLTIYLPPKLQYGKLHFLTGDVSWHTKIIPEVWVTNQNKQVKKKRKYRIRHLCIPSLSSLKLWVWLTKCHQLGFPCLLQLLIPFYFIGSYCS